MVPETERWRRGAGFKAAKGIGYPLHQIALTGGVFQFDRVGFFLLFFVMTHRNELRNAVRYVCAKAYSPLNRRWKQLEVWTKKQRKNVFKLRTLQHFRNVRIRLILLFLCNSWLGKHQAPCAPSWQPICTAHVGGLVKNTGMGKIILKAWFVNWKKLQKAF